MFEEMSRDEDLINSLPSCFGSIGFYDEVLVLFEQRLDVVLLLSLDSAFHEIMACGESGYLKKSIRSSLYWNPLSACNKRSVHGSHLGASDNSMVRNLFGAYSQGIEPGDGRRLNKR